MSDRCPPNLARLALAAVVWASVSCSGPTPPLALSPLGHGGPPSRRGPSPIGALWRANGLSAPSPQGCAISPQSHSIACAPPTCPDGYASALTEASL
jgi:hypothetical protein